jgi:F0F1-type ATP synthase membrane subunit b/b'
MRLRSLYVVGVLAIALIFMGVTFAQKPEMNIDPARHSNLAAAQHHIGEAFEKIQEAQRANKDELGGHAEKAIELLNQANHELKEAAEFVDHHHK